RDLTVTGVQTCALPICHAAGMLVFALVAGFIGLFVGAADGFICRLPRRAILCGAVGLVVGIVGGFICSIAANLAYAPLTKLALKIGRASCRERVGVEAV